MSGSRIRKNIPALTGLRWVAAFLVVLRHNPPQQDSRLYPVFSNGHSGVTLFFVLSGFVLAVNYFDRFPALSLRGLRNFYVARLARIYPLYLLVLIGYGVAFRFDEWLVVLQHVAVVQAWSSDSDVAYAMNGPGWSLGVEAFFYLLFPFLLIALRRMLVTRVRALMLLASSLTLVFLGSLFFQISSLGDLPENDPNSMWRWLYRNPAFRLGDFVAGIALAAIYINRERIVVSTVGRVLGYLPWVALILLLSLRSLIDNPFGVDFAFAVVACGIIIYTADVPESTISRILSSKPLVMLGEFSFAAYLVHVPIRQAFFPSTFTNGFSTRSVAEFALYLAFVVAVSAILHYIVERPARASIRRRFAFLG